MIKIQTLDRIDNIEHVVIPTIFPDNTSQCWKLPKEIIQSLSVKITWNFEVEREIIDILSLTKLFPVGNKHLHIPYLPYARQDKQVYNEFTFNLHILAELLNLVNFNLVTAVDVHNPKETQNLIKNFKNIKVENLIEMSLKFIQTDGIVFPDYGASQRYNLKLNGLVCEKKRNQQTGEITGHYIHHLYKNDINVKKIKRLLIVDDICDGGATFISVAKMLKKINPEINIDLYVTHGIFSKGKQVLHDAGIQNIYTTNSLLKNEDGFKV